MPDPIIPTTRGGYCLEQNVVRTTDADGDKTFGCTTHEHTRSEVCKFNGGLSVARLRNCAPAVENGALGGCKFIKNKVFEC